MKPIEIACRHIENSDDYCEAQAGEQCRKAGRFVNFFHAERTEDAMLMSSSPGNNVSDEQLDEAIENTGIL